MTPHFRFFQTHPTYTHIRVFGSLCYPYLTTPHKLSPRSFPCVFLSYPSNHHGYRCLDLESRKIIISRHVTFDENTFPFKSVTPTEPPYYDFLDTLSTPSPSFDYHNQFQSSQHNTSPTMSSSFSLFSIIGSTFLISI